ncbi:PilZ domain-containing protein [Aliiglaciecola sp. CAU 1673]|uniref:PilZ domain-containing protein n=1 Tax=Aliiglaciecola sp. CAU 1673 TaxID=3032595 RepID=UPI0023DBDF08|nr:PilZ domain-containing protein [Aliiglaciecola sp. CAU 1673]MDF2178839.1 PilZ domain-containing protein [Aliiglaciecola sp. CAU 1673]
MDNLTLEQKKQQFDEYFRIKHPIKVNLLPLPEQFVLPETENIEMHMPYAFRIAAEMSALEVSALRPLRNLSEHAADLVAYLNHQSRKIDLMMSYILQSQSSPEHQYQALSFGGGGVVLESATPLDLEQLVELRLFLEEEASAVFCFGEVIACEKQDEQYHISLIFNRIREQDQELLVRASLHLQTQQLRKRAKQRSPE